MPVHPACDLFPMMSEAELRALGEDIKKHGLKSPIILWSPDANQRTAASLLDGRGRLSAMELVGLDTAACSHQQLYGPVVDPYAYVLSANIHRRHLSAAEKRDLIVAVLKAQPEKSSRRPTHSPDGFRVNRTTKPTVTRPTRTSPFERRTTMSDITLEAMIRRLSRVTEDIFNEQGEVDTCWLVDIPGEGQKLIASPIVVPPGVSPGEVKTHIACAIRELFEKLSVTRYAHAAECWVGPEDAGDTQEWIAEHGSLANYPGRREAIIINAEDGDQILMAMRTIIRPAHGKPYLTKLEIERPDSLQGRFSGLLPARPMMQ
jgi:hypothetical protein